MIKQQIDIFDINGENREKYFNEELNLIKLPKNFFKNNLFFYEKKEKSGKIYVDKSIKNRLGFLPCSIWKPNEYITKIMKKIINDTSQVRKTLNSNRSDRRNGVNDGKCSVFNPHLAQMILSAYAPLNAKIYDPFGGGGTRGYIATKMGCDYTGVEIREEEYNRVKEQMKKWNINFNFILGDSMIYSTNEKFDFCFTCPPYYDLELYSNLPNDLSNANTYEDFLKMLKKIINNVFNMLKDNCFAVFVVGNFRKENGELCHFNGDLIRIAKEIGFKLWDEIIWEGASKVALTRCGKFEKNRKSVRMHEYIIVLKK